MGGLKQDQWKKTETGLRLEREVWERTGVPLVPDVVDEAGNGSGVTDDMMDEHGELIVQKEPSSKESQTI